MEKLATAAANNLHETLSVVSTGKAAKRLITALAYKDGVSVETLNERYAVPRSTVYYWLNRFEEMPIDEAIEDEDRPGQPPTFTRDECNRLQADLEQSPRTSRFKSNTWSSDGLHKHIMDKHGVKYSEGHIRRLIR
jgi:transposase